MSSKSIKIQYKGNIYDIEVDKNDTIGHVKKIIEIYTGVSAEDQILKDLPSQQIDFETVDTLGILNNQVIQLVTPFEIEDGGNNEQLDVDMIDEDEQQQQQNQNVIDLDKSLGNPNLSVGSSSNETQTNTNNEDIMKILANNDSVSTEEQNKIMEEQKRILESFKNQQSSSSSVPTQSTSQPNFDPSNNQNVISIDESNTSENTNIGTSNFVDNSHLGQYMQYTDEGNINLNNIYGGSSSQRVVFKDILLNAYKPSELNEFFREGPFDEAFDLSRAKHKLLFSIVYSSDKNETLQFATDILMNQGILDIVKANFVLWVADMNQTSQMNSLIRMVQRNNQAADQFNVQNLPISFISCYFGGSFALVEVMNGKQSPDTIVQKLLMSIQNYGSILETSKEEKENAQFNTESVTDSLRFEQDQRYKQAVQKDIELMQQKKKEEEEKKKKEEALLKEKKLEEEREKQEAEREKQRQSKRQEKEQKLLEEPPKGKDVATIRFRLSDGNSVTRRFKLTDTVNDLFDFLDVKHQVDEEKHNLLLNFPKQVFTYNTEQSNKTLKENNLNGSIQLYIICI